MNDRKLPDDPLDFIRICVKQSRIFWSYHVNMRLEERAISRRMLIENTDSYELVESYPEDKYYPSYLILVRDQDKVLHVLFATDVEEHNVRVITAYHPDPAEWDDELKKRKRT